jgi:hypothetical protein
MELAWFFPNTQKIQSLAVKVSLPNKIDLALDYIILSSIYISGGNLREIVVVVGH